MWETLLIANPGRRNAKSLFGTGRKSRYQRRMKGKIGSDLFAYSRPTRKSIVRHRRKLKGSKRYKSGALAWLGSTNPTRRNQNILTDALAGQIASEVASKLGKGFSRASSKKVKTKKRKVRRRNPHLAIIGANPHKEKKMARRRRRNVKRNAKGRFVKATAKRRRNRSTPKRRRRNAKKVVVVNRRRRKARATPRRRRRRNAARVVIKYKYRTRKANPMARRRRKKVSHRRRRRNYSRATSVRRRSNPRRRTRRYSRRRRNAGIGSLVGRVNIMQVAEVAGGVFIGDKLTSYLSNMVAGYIGITDPGTLGFLKLGVGVVSAGFIWRFRPALGLGIAVGAANSLLNQYVFTPLWGYATPYLPGGMAGLGEYKSQSWKIDPWLGGAGNTAVAGLGSFSNKLLSKGL